MRVERWPDAGAFRARAERWLLQAEAEHNMILGLLDQLERDPSAYDPPIYLATVEEGGEVVGCAYRTPPFKLGLTRMPLAGAKAIAEDVASVYDELPRVLGAEDVALRFGERWAELRGVTARPAARLRIFSAEAVLPLDRKAAGRARVATLDDLEVVTRLREAFQRETNVEGLRGAMLETRVRAGAFWLWEDGGRPTCLAGWPARTERWARIGNVYTPPELRRRGYATALVADLTDRLLAEGCRYTVLYTDLANPTSNSIYQQIGYRPLADVVDVALGA